MFQYWLNTFSWGSVVLALIYVGVGAFWVGGVGPSKALWLSLSLCNGGFYAIAVAPLHSVSALLSALIPGLWCVECADCLSSTAPSFPGDIMSHSPFLAESPAVYCSSFVSHSKSSSQSRADLPTFGSSDAQISQMCLCAGGRYLLSLNVQLFVISRGEIWGYPSCHSTFFWCPRSSLSNHLLMDT